MAAGTRLTNTRNRGKLAKPSSEHAMLSSSHGSCSPSLELCLYSLLCADSTGLPEMPDGLRESWDLGVCFGDNCKRRRSVVLPANTTKWD